MQAQSKAMTWIGWILSILVALQFFMGAAISLIRPPAMAQEMAKQFKIFGFTEEILPVLGIIMLVCAILYIIPRTAVLGAVLLTGYLGGAVVTHLRVHDVFVMPIIVGILAWLALYLRDQRVRALLPFC